MYISPLCHFWPSKCPEISLKTSVYWTVIHSLSQSCAFLKKSGELTRHGGGALGGVDDKNHIQALYRVKRGSTARLKCHIEGINRSPRPVTSRHRAPFLPPFCSSRFCWSPGPPCIWSENKGHHVYPNITLWHCSLVEYIIVDVVHGKPLKNQH